MAKKLPYQQVNFNISVYCNVMVLPYGSEGENHLLFSGQECQMTPVIHVLRHPGCKPKAIPSFACVGKCTSYVQVPNHSLQLTMLLLRTYFFEKIINILDLRCPEAKYGKWSELAIAARNLGNGKLQSFCFVLRPRTKKKDL